jgi:anti-sigma factor ChrR (cupin superfamily)
MGEKALSFPELFRMADRPDAIAWQPFREGVRIHRLYGDGTGPAAALLRYEPGAKIPGHRHPAHEHILVLSGSQSDENGRHRAGALIVNTPGSAHHVESEEGCVVLAIWAAPVEFLDS